MGTAAVQNHGFFYNLFAPLPEEPLPEEEETDPREVRKDGFDHLATYTATISGAWDLFRVFDHVMQYAQKIPNLSDASKDSASKISRVANLGGIALSVPMIVSDLNTARKKAGEFMTALSLDDNTPMRQQKVLQAGKGAFLGTMWLTNTVAQAVLFLHESGLVKLAQYFPVADGVYQGSSFISDGIELVDQAYKLDAYQNAEPVNENEAATIEEKKWLAYMVAIKDIASVALAAIALVGIALQVAVFSIPTVAVVGLGLSTIWLAAKISSYFYSEIITERMKERQVLAVAVAI